MNHKIGVGRFSICPTDACKKMFLDGEWINNTTYCNGKDSECTSEIIVTVPKITMSSPGHLSYFVT